MLCAGRVTSQSRNCPSEASLYSPFAFTYLICTLWPWLDQAIWVYLSWECTNLSSTLPLITQVCVSSTEIQGLWTKPAATTAFWSMPFLHFILLCNTPIYIQNRNQFNKWIQSLVSLHLLSQLLAEWQQQAENQTQKHTSLRKLSSSCILPNIWTHYSRQVVLFIAGEGEES